MKKTKKKRVTKVANESKQVRLRSLLILCFILLPVALYLSYAAGGLYNKVFELNQLKATYFWCLLHPVQCYNDKTAGVLALAFLVWLIASFSAYNKLNNNLMHGKEYGSAKWGSIHAFNQKYAAKGTPEKPGLSPDNKVLSENVRFRYTIDTLRNGNTFVVGGSGAGKTSFFLTPNLLSLHDCNIYTDPKGTLVEEFGAWLSKQKDTKVDVINMCEMEKSMHFNPFLYLRKKSDVTRLVGNLIQNTNTANIKNSSADPFWERAERMFLESLFLYVWMECPTAIFNKQTGNGNLLARNWKSILILLDEAQFGDKDHPPLLDGRMDRLEQKKSGHPAVKAYRRYRSGPEETARSVIMTVNARMQPFDNDELLDIFSKNEIPLDEFGVGKEGDGKTKHNLFIVIPDDDDTFNFVPGMVYTLLFQELYRQARFFGGKLPMDVGFWFDEFSNIKMPNNFDKILATCRSRGVYCVPILQSLAQIKTLFADGAWEGIVGNCDTFLYLGGNEASTFEYISKMLGKWTIDKKTNGESKGSSGSYSENYDVLGRELMLEYEIRLLPDDECILFLRGEDPIRDKKWFPWEHEEYRIAKEAGEFIPEDITRKSEEERENCQFITQDSLEYMKKQSVKDDAIRIYPIDAYGFMMMNLDEAMGKAHGRAGQKKENPEEILIRPELIRAAIEIENKQLEMEKEKWYRQNFEKMSLLDIFSSGMISEQRQRVIKEMIKEKVEEKVIKNIIHPELSETEVMEKKKAWVVMHNYRG